MKRSFTILLIVFCLFKTNSSTAQLVPNGDFELWTPDIDGILNPDYWITTNASPDTSVFQYTPAYSGNYSMRVASYYIIGFGPMAGIAYVEFPYTCRPTQIHVCVKTNIAAGDIGYVMLSLHNGDSTIAAMDSCTFKFLTSIPFQCFDFPISYVSSMNPDSAIVMVIAGNFTTAQLGTEVIVDEISFNCPTAIDESMPESATIGKNYPNPSSGFTFIPLNLIKGSDVSITIYNAYGEEVKILNPGYRSTGASIISVPVDDLANGIYFYTVTGNDFKLPGKIIVNK
jgi:hypothetical protein